MIDLGGPLAIIMFGLWIYCLVDVATSDRAQVRNLPKWIWFAVVLVLWVFGAILWLLVGRPRKAFAGGYEGDSAATSSVRQAPLRRPRPPSRADQAGEEADVQARIAERDRQLARWAEEDRRRSIDASSDVPPRPGPDAGAGPGPLSGPGPASGPGPTSGPGPGSGAGGAPGVPGAT